jgi:hypothetical protein
VLLAAVALPIAPLITAVVLAVAVVLTRPAVAVVEKNVFAAALVATLALDRYPLRQTQMNSFTTQEAPATPTHCPTPASPFVLVSASATNVALVIITKSPDVIVPPALQKTHSV